MLSTAAPDPAHRRIHSHHSFAPHLTPTLRPALPAPSSPLATMSDSASVYSYFSQSESITFRNDQPFSEQPRGRPRRTAGEIDTHDQSMYALLEDSVVAFNAFDTKSPGPERVDSDADTLVSAVASESVSQASTVGPRVHFACLEKDMGGLSYTRLPATLDDVDVVLIGETHKRFSGRSRAPSPYPWARREESPRSLRALVSRARLDVKVRCRSLEEKFGRSA
jgi:hypothetical protein